MSRDLQKREIDPMTGGTDGTCHFFPIIDSNDAPSFKRTKIFEKVFGAMEGLRVEESLRCRRRFSRDNNIKTGGWGTMHRPRFQRKNPSDMAFATLTAYFYESSVRTYDWVFPINTEQFLRRVSK